MNLEAFILFINEAGLSNDIINENFGILKDFITEDTKKKFILAFLQEQLILNDKKSQLVIHNMDQGNHDLSHHHEDDENYVRLSENLIMQIRSREG